MKPPKTARCPKCGFEAKRTPEEIAIEEGELVKLEKKPKKADKESFYGELMTVAKERGYADGWV